MSLANAALSLGRLYSSHMIALGSGPVNFAASRLSRVPSADGIGAHRSSTFVTGSEKYSGSRPSPARTVSRTSSVLPQPGGPCSSTVQRPRRAARTTCRTGSGIVEGLGTPSDSATWSRISAVRSSPGLPSGSRLGQPQPLPVDQWQAPAQREPLPRVRQDVVQGARGQQLAQGGGERRPQ